MEKTAKKALFRELHQLDNDQSEEEDCSNVAAILGRSKPPTLRVRAEARPSQITPRSLTRLDQPFGRTVSAPLSGLRTTPRSHTSPLRTTSFSSVSSSRSERKDFQISGAIGGNPISCATNSTIMPKSNGKRKRGQSFERKPESQQIFKGLSFFFIPNNDVAAPRKLRIRKAMEFGALWVRQWQDSITHVVVDKGICYQDILKFLEIPSLPPNMILVNEVYPSDCLIYKSLMKPDQRYYQVEGQDVAPVAEHSPTPIVSSSETSLQLKPDKSRELQSQNTALRTESSEQNEPKPADDIINNTINQRPTHRLARATSLQYNALDQAIEDAKAVQDLPLDLDEDDDPGHDRSLEESEAESNEDEKRPRSKAKKSSFTKSWQEGFSCMSKHDGKGKTENPNARTIEMLQRMADYYDQSHDHWRCTAYRKAIGALRKQDGKVTTAKEAFAIPFIGQRLADKIEEIVSTDRLRRLESTKWEPNDEVLQLFLNVYGAGLKQATRWVDQGYRTLADLVNRASLTKNQKIGIEHFEDFKNQIPRKEMQRHEEYVRDACSKIDSTIQVTIGGSYRRGAADSGDVDFIITKPNCPVEVLRTIILETVIPHFFQEDYLKASLATTSKEDGTKWHGAATLPGNTVWRRIDFLLVPWDEMGAALIYFTGNDIFNRSIRLLASKKGMRLNQRGLWKDVIRGQNRQRITQGTLVEAKDERKIFEHLGVPWRPPHHRIC